MINILKIAFSFLIILSLASCGNDKSSTMPSKEKQQIVKSETCELEEEKTPINFYISEKWISDNKNCFTPELKKKIEEKLYSFVKKVPASQISDNVKYYKLLTVLNPDKLLYKEKFNKYEIKLVAKNKKAKIKPNFKNIDSKGNIRVVLSSLKNPSKRNLNKFGRLVCNSKEYCVIWFFDDKRKANYGAKQMRSGNTWDPIPGLISLYIKNKKVDEIYCYDLNNGC
jgi:hypothetical protein